MNRENFKKVLDSIKANPERWDQTQFHSVCNTTHCFAGWAEVLSGSRSGISTNEIKHNAEIYLNITDRQSVYLFASHRTIEDFESFLKDN